MSLIVSVASHTLLHGEKNGKTQKIGQKLNFLQFPATEKFPQPWCKLQLKVKIQNFHSLKCPNFIVED